VDLAPSPIWYRVVDDSTAAVDLIAREIGSLRAANPAGEADIRSSRLGAGGWRMNMDESTHLRTLHAAVRDLYGTALKELGFEHHHALASQAVMKSWINILGKGGENVLHNHPNCHLSAVYYVRTPQGSGNLRLYAPRRFPASMDDVNPDMRKRYVPLTRGSPLSSAALEMRIEPGLLVLFPSYLEHKVVPYAPKAAAEGAVAAKEEDTPPRVSVAFNIMPLIDPAVSETVRATAHGNRVLASNWAHLDFRSWAVGAAPGAQEL
jgi:uncharacterized protein (TIGR02466 family)